MAAGDILSNPHLRSTPMVDVNGVAGHRHQRTPTAPSATLSDSAAQAQALAAATVPRDRNPEFAAYYLATDVKHFGERTEPGSKFADPSLRQVEDVVALAVAQRGHLDGDDRELFIDRGADPAAFRDGNRYLFVWTPGTVGVIDTFGMDGDIEVHVVRTKPGAPCFLVFDVDEQETTDYAVVILAEDLATQQPIVLTVFPGVVTRSDKHDDIEALEGGTITLRQARLLLGGESWMNTRLRA